MNVQFGENLKRLRKQKGVTQGEVAKVLAVSGQSVSRWELGICYPDLEWLPKIANYFGVTVDSLLSNDQAAKNEDIRQFFARYESFEYSSAAHIRFIKGYCKRYPDNDQYACLLVKAICAAILKKREDVESNYYALLYEYGEHLLKTQYRNDMIEAMVCVCSESELEKWLSMCPVNATFSRRSCLARRYDANGRYDMLSTQQGLAMFENFALELDHRYPDTNGAENKEAFQRAIMRVICSFGENNEPPDAWKKFYAYKQLVLSACLFAQGKTEQGWEMFDAAMHYYRSVHESKQEFLCAGGVLFSNLRINHNWTFACDGAGVRYELPGLREYSYASPRKIETLLSDPRYVWFDSVREKACYRAALLWVRDERKKEDAMRNME